MLIKQNKYAYAMSTHHETEAVTFWVIGKFEFNLEWNSIGYCSKWHISY